MNINTLNVSLISHTRGSGNLIWSTLTWSTRGTHMRLGSTMSEAMMSTMVPSDNELEGDEMWWEERALQQQHVEVITELGGFLWKLTWRPGSPKGSSCRSSWFQESGGKKNSFNLAQFKWWQEGSGSQPFSLRDFFSIIKKVDYIQCITTRGQNDCTIKYIMLFFSVELVHVSGLHFYERGDETRH